MVKLGRTEEPAAAVHGEDSPGKSAVRWRKLGRRSHTDVVVKLGKGSRMVEQRQQELDSESKCRELTV